MGFDIYKRKFAEQPFPRKHVKSFENINQVINFIQTDSRKPGEEVKPLTPEEAVEVAVGADVRGYEVEETMAFLGDGLLQEEIAKRLDTDIPRVSKILHRSMKKLKNKGKLKKLLLMVGTLRSKQYSEVIYSHKITIQS